MIEVNCAELLCDAGIHFSGLSRISPHGFRGLWAHFQNSSHPSLLRPLITSVAMSTQGGKEGCVVTALSHGSGSNTRTARRLIPYRYATEVVHSCTGVCNRSPLQLQKQMSRVYSRHSYQKSFYYSRRCFIKTTLLRCLTTYPVVSPTLHTHIFSITLVHIFLPQTYLLINGKINFRIYEPFFTPQQNHRSDSQATFSHCYLVKPLKNI